MENKKDRKLDGLIILCVALLGFIVSVVSFFWRRSGQIQSFVFGEEGIFYLFVLYYGVWGYKKPHGNLLRYLMLLLAAVTAATILMQIDHWDAPWPVIFSSNLAAVLIGYMAGRLPKVKKNRCVDFLRYTALIAADMLSLDKTVEICKAKEVQIRCNVKNFAAELDGDSVATSPLSISLLPTPLNFIS